MLCRKCFEGVLLVLINRRKLICAHIQDIPVSLITDNLSSTNIQYIPQGCANIAVNLLFK